LLLSPLDEHLACWVSANNFRFGLAVMHSQHNCALAACNLHDIVNHLDAKAYFHAALQKDLSSTKQKAPGKHPGAEEFTESRSA
jgi:hypothetical protein